MTAHRRQIWSGPLFGAVLSVAACGEALVIGRDFGEKDASVDADCPSEMATVDGAVDETGCAARWAAYVDALDVPSCPQAPVLVVATTTMELDGGADIDDPALAGAALSLREALLIAKNRAGPDTIMFDGSVFAPNAPATIFVDGVSDLPTVEETCIDARGRGVRIDCHDEQLGRSGLWGLGSGSLQVGLMFLRMPHEQRLSGGHVAGCRYQTDGQTWLPGRAPSSIAAVGEVRIGPGNVFASNIGISTSGAGATIVQNFFHVDPLTEARFGTGAEAALFAGNLMTPVDTVAFEGNVVASSRTVFSTEGARAELRNNRFGVDFGGRPIEDPSGFWWQGPGTGVFGPGNVVTGVDVGVAVLDGGEVRITRNSIFDNGEGIAFFEVEAPNAPQITMATQAGARGTCPAAGMLELFSDLADQGELFLAVVPCDEAMEWAYTGSVPPNRNLTATLTVASRTSQFSVPVPVN